MAKQMEFTDSYGNIYPASYWRLVQINIDIADKSALILFFGYKDDVARQSKKTHFSQKLYELYGDKVAEYFGVKVLDVSNPMKQAYRLAVDTLDTNDNMDSFFKTAIDV